MLYLYTSLILVLLTRLRLLRCCTFDYETCRTHAAVQHRKYELCVEEFLKEYVLLHNTA